jgi:hypothetical protein
MQEIEQVASTGAANYYRFLEQTGKGCEIIRVRSIEHIDTSYHLFIEKNPFSTDAVKFLINGTEYDQKQLLIYEQDRDLRILYVRVTEGHTDPLINVSPSKVQVISNLKFLVRRVHDWYENNPNSLRFPCPSPTLQIQEFIQPDLSCDQQAAVYNVFKHAPSYIWGAPGTGKTRYVLSECLLQYCLSDQQVVVLAPTNNAIEQVLYGVLEKLQEKNIPMEDVIRLGTPSMRFAEEYGEICEVQGIEKRLAEIAEQIRLLQEFLEFRAFLERLRYVRYTIIPMFDHVQQTLCKIAEEQNSLHSVAISVTEAERHVRSCKVEQHTAERAVTSQRMHMQTLMYKIGKAFTATSEQAAKEKLSQLEETERAATKNVSDAEFMLDSAKRNREAARARLGQLDQTIDASMYELSNRLAAISGFDGINASLNRNTLDLCRQKIFDKIAQGDAIQIQRQERYTHYKYYRNVEIETRIAELKEQQTIIAAQTTEERLKQVKIIAATIDTFLFRFQPANLREQTNPIRFKHIFLDEAGYCSLAKALILFGYGCPVTMLGDHMQLPPVCEADDDELENAGNENIFLFAQSALYAEDAFLHANTPVCLLEQYLHHEMPEFTELQKNDLRETYRFGELLANVLEKCVYRNGFASANPDALFTIEVLNAPRLPGKAKHQSPIEAQEIAERLQYLGTDDYAILTPYRNQVQLLSHEIPKAHREHRIMTIHASQGREWDTVFLSVVDTTDMYFADTNRRNIGGLQIINTAVSRARSRLIIVCDTTFWIQQDGQMINELIHAAKSI